MLESRLEVHCEFCQQQLEILPIRKVVADSIGTDVSRIGSNSYCQIQNTKKMSKCHLIHLAGYFDDYCQFLGYFPLLGEKYFSTILLL